VPPQAPKARNYVAQRVRGCYETLLPWSGVNSKIRELKYLGYK
jgi:hypothetical protein